MSAALHLDPEPLIDREPDVARMLARGIDVVRLRAMGFDEAWVDSVCDESLTLADWKRLQGFEDDGPDLILHTPEELDTFVAGLADGAYASST